MPMVFRSTGGTGWLMQIALPDCTGQTIPQQMLGASQTTATTMAFIGTNTPSLYCGATNTITSASTPCGTAYFNCGGVGLIGQLVIGGGEIVIDEEDLVNHAEYFELARQRGIAFRIRTAEERRRADEEQARARARAAAEAADLRSRELLFRHLTAEQRRTVEKNKWFVVVGGKSGTSYRIRTDYGVAGNISVMQGDRAEATLCCHCSHDIPAHDQFLAQKLALMWDEDNFLNTANRRAA